MQQAKSDAALLATLADDWFGEDRSAKYTVRKVVSMHSRGKRLWRVKVLTLKGLAKGYRVLYAFDQSRQVFYVLGIPSRLPMTNPIPVSSVSLPSTTASSFPESVRRTLAVVPETRGQPVVFLEPIMVDAPLPPDFVDVDTLVEQEEKDLVVKQAIATGRKAVANAYYSAGPQPLSYHRLSHGWSQKELAERMGTSQSYIARLEAGDVDPQVSTVKRLAAVFELPASVMLDAITAKAAQS
jgi:DNA-binding XRE family transcriptional regulator